MTTTSTSAPRTSSSSQPSLLREQLAQFNGATKPFNGPLVSGRTVLGWLLTLCGLGVSGWVLFAIHSTIFHPERIGLPLRLIKVEDLVMSIPAGEIQLPAVGVTLISYLLTVLLLAIAGKIAIVQLKMGTALLGNDRVDLEIKKLES